MVQQHFTGAWKMSSRGQAPWGDKIMTLLYSQWSKENQFLSQNRGVQGKCWTCHNLAPSIHLLIPKCWCKSTTSWALWMQRWTNRNNPFPHSVYCLLGGQVSPKSVHTELEKCSLEQQQNQSAKQYLRQAGCPLPYPFSARHSQEWLLVVP